MSKLILFDHHNRIIVTKEHGFIELDCHNLIDILSVLDKVDSALCDSLRQINNKINQNLDIHNIVTKIILSGTEYYVAMLSSEISADASNYLLSQNFHVYTVRELILNSDENKIALISKAKQLALWNHDHKYCGRCANVTKRIMHEYARECTVCKHIVYPRISPCILAAIIKNDQILLARSPHFPLGVYSLIAGFVEVGETCEEAVVREVFEETGARVNNIKYFGSQQWPFPHSMMLAYTADYIEGDLVIDKNELEDARWFSFESLRTCPELLPNKIGLSRRLLDYLITQHTYKYI